MVKKKESLLGTTLFQAGVGPLIFVLVLFVLWIIIEILRSWFGIIIPINDSNLYLFLAILATIGTAMYVLNYNRLRKEQDEKQKQRDLLIILLEELDFLSGNLKAYKESFSKPNHYPLYELWEIDTSLYFSSLSHKINEGETLELKKNLMKIKDKIILINNFKMEMINLEVKRGNEPLIKAIKPGEKIRNQIIKIIDKEVLPIVENSKKRIITLIND